MNIFPWFLEPFIEKCRFSTYTTLGKIWLKVLISIKLNKYIIIVIDCLEFDETFEHLWHLRSDRS